MLTLALGIGANSAIFSVAKAVLWSRLPFVRADRLVYLDEQPRKGDSISISFPDFSDWKASSRSFEDMALMHRRYFTLNGAQQPERLMGAEVHWNFFPILKIRPALGRSFTPQEDDYGADRKVILSRALWQRSFGADRNVLGRTVDLDGLSYTVIGVMGFDLDLPSAGTQLWIPVGLRKDAHEPAGRVIHPGMRGVARLRPGVSLAQARGELLAIGEQLERLHPDSNTGLRPVVMSLRDRLVEDWHDTLLLLLGAVGLVLLIACTNVSHLLLARASGRRREIAVRAALGAGRTRLLRQLLAEGLLLAGVGGSLGLLVGFWGLELLVRILPGDVPRLAEVRLDGTVLGFTSAVSLLGGVLFSLVPAFSALRMDLNEALKEGGRWTAGGSRRMRSAMVVGEMALAMTLLVGAGLLLNSLWRVLQADPGFRSDRLTTMQMSVPEARYSERAAQLSFFRDLEERVAAEPGVEACGLVSTLPVTSAHNRTAMIPVDRPEPPPGQAPLVELNQASPGYFQAMGIPLRSGRFFAQRDSTARVAIVDETLARSFWPDRDPIGRQMRYVPGASVPVTVIGVVGHVKDHGVDAASSAQMYVPWARSLSMTLVVRTSGGSDPTPAVRAAVRELDREVPVSSVRTMEQVLDEHNASRRASATLLAAFAGAALLLAAVGLYGVLAYAVSQRIREIGIRMVLGARRGSVVRLVVGQGMTLAAAGLALGCGGALAASRLLKDFLFGVEASDPATFAVLSAVLALVALLACYLPARRAAGVDPMTALRYE